MSALDAVEHVLKAAGEPLHYREIVRRALAAGLWSSKGKTPERTICARLAVDIKQNGRNSRFQRNKNGTFALRTWSVGDEPAAGGQVEKPVPKNDTLSFTDAAERVLDRYGTKKPMHYRAITERALEVGLVSTAGKTPEASLYAQVLMEIRRRERQGVQPRFVKFGRGLIGLSKWLPVGLASQIAQNNEQVRKRLHQRLLKMPWGDFEALVGRFLIALGFEEVEVTKKCGDNGIDVRGTMLTGDVVRTRMAVQVKRWKIGRNIQAPHVQQVRGSLGAHEQGLIITTSGFSKGARGEARRADVKPVGLMDGEHLVRLLAEQEIGVRSTPHRILELVEEQEAED